MKHFLLSLFLIFAPFSYTQQTPHIEASKQEVLPLFKAYPKLAKKLPHIQLASLPTPIIQLKNLGKKININHLYFKNDGVTSALFGGNKVRKLEFLLADAQQKKVSLVTTIGGAGSNHATATASHANKLGMPCSLLLCPQESTSYLRRNLLLMNKSKAAISYFEDDNNFSKEVAMAQQNPDQEYFIPSGGSTPVGVIGFVNAAFELKEQIKQGLLPEPDYLYVPLGSGGTSAGLALGLHLAGLKTKIVLVPISRSKGNRIKNFVNLYNQTSAYLHRLTDTCSLLTTEVTNWEHNNMFSKEKYASLIEKVADTIQLLYHTEKIKLDSTYSGRAFTAMLEDVTAKNRGGKVILFWGTFCSGDFNDIVGSTTFRTLPRNLHAYFENELHHLDQGY